MGGELTPVNVSIYDETEQLDQDRKWHYWMDASRAGFDNPINAFEGGNYSQFGVYRASSNSMMRALGRPFSLVNAEQLLKEIYREVSPIESGSVSGTLISRGGSVGVTPMQPLGHDLTILWYLNGVLQTDLIGATSVSTDDLVIDGSSHELKVKVFDATTWVRDEAMRAEFMTEERIYTIRALACLADLTGDGELDFFDIGAFLTYYEQENFLADFNSDLSIDFFDIAAFLSAYTAGCP